MSKRSSAVMASRCSSFSVNRSNSRVPSRPSLSAEATKRLRGLRRLSALEPDVPELHSYLAFCHLHASVHIGLHRLIHDGNGQARFLLILRGGR